jgi:hypothetical protein
LEWPGGSGSKAAASQDGEGMPNLRQKILILYLTDSALDSKVIGWAMYDGTGQESHNTGDSDQPPFGTGLEALRAGWRAIQFSQLAPPYPGTEFSTSFYKYEVIFERLEDVHD